MMRRALLRILFSIGISSNVYGQAETGLPESYWGTGLGLRSQKFTDALVTQSRFSGTPIYFLVNHEKTNPKTWRSFELEASIGQLRTKQFEPGQMPSRFQQPALSLYWNEITYTHLPLIRKSERGRLHVGPSVYHLVSVRLSPRWDNSQVNYEFSGGLQAEARFFWEFDFWQKNMRVATGLKLPLIGYLSRPGFSGVPDFLDHEKDFVTSLFDNTTIAWMGSFPRIQCDNFVEFPIAGGNKIRLIYNWEFYSIQRPMAVSAAAHTFSINFLMRTK